MADEHPDEVAARPPEHPSFCVWRLHEDGTRSLMATYADEVGAGRFADELAGRGMAVAVVAQVRPYGHTDSTRLWTQPLPHPLLEGRVSRYVGRVMDRRAAVSLAMGWLPTDELLRMLREHAAAGAADDDRLALLEEVLRLRSRDETGREHQARLAGALSMVAAVLYRLDRQVCTRALDLHGFSSYDLWGQDRPPYGLDEDWIDELVAEAHDAE